MPVANLGQNKLAKLSSDTPIDDGAVSTNQIKYDVEDYGKFVPIERSLTDDEVVGIVEIHFNARLCRRCYSNRK